MDPIQDFSAVFEVEVKARKLRNGHRMQIVLEKAYEPEEFAAMTRFQFERAAVMIVHHLEQPDLEGIDEEDDDGEFQGTLIDGEDEAG